MYSCPTGTQPYKVQAGDSLWLIAQKFHMPLQAIEEANQEIDMDNLYIGQIICIPGDFGLQPLYAQLPPVGISPAQETLNNHMRLLWEQHVFWTRMVISSMVFNLPDTELVTIRLLRNPQDFALALRPFYGSADSAKFAELLTTHIKIAGELIKATKEGDNTAADDARTQWYNNADEIADFLNSINPYWTIEEWQRLLYDHLKMTEEELMFFISKNYAEGIVEFENIEYEALEMADTMTQGIVNQFPQYFR